MLITAYRDARPGIRIAYGTNDPLLNQQRMHFQSRVSTTTVHKLLFAVDCAPSTISEEDMQGSTDLFSTAYENFCLIDLEKDSEDGRCDLRSHPHRRRECQTRRPQVSAAPIPDYERTTASNVSTVQLTFQVPTGLVRYLWINCSTKGAPTGDPPSSSSSSSKPSTNSDRLPEPPLPSFSFSPSSFTPVPTAAVVAPVTHGNSTQNPDTTATTNTYLRRHQS
nr:unnamed protein product [Spirometra erinaceieuropaei]